MATAYYDLSIIIVSFNTVDLLKQCVESLEKHLLGKLNFITVVVDNNSHDGSREWLQSFQENKSWVQAILLDDNVGFARANNIGIHRTSGKNVLLLNSDTYLLDDSLCRAVEHLDKNPKLFGCGCMLLDKDKRPDISYGFFPSLPLLTKEILTNRFNQLRAVIPSESDGITAIDFPCGAFFLLKKDLYDLLGGLDETFFMYFEETDLAKRARKKGYSIEYFSGTKIVHLRGGSSGSDGGPLTTIFYQSWNYYFKKHHSFLGKIALNFLLSSFFSAMILKSLFANKVGLRTYYKYHLRGLVRSWVRNRDSVLRELKK